MIWKCDGSDNCKKVFDHSMAIFPEMIICHFCKLFYCGNCYKAEGVGLNLAAYVCFARQNHKECSESVSLV